MSYCPQCSEYEEEIRLLRATVDRYEAWAKISTKGFSEETLKEFASRSVPQEGQPASNTQLCPGCHAVNRNHSTECKRLARTASNKEGTEMSALWTALHRRSHEGLVDDYMQLMEIRSDREKLIATLTQERDALRLHVERLDAALEECWFNDDTTLSLPEWKVELLTQADFKIFSARAALASPEEQP